MRGPAQEMALGRVPRGGRLCVQFASQGSRVTGIIFWPGQHRVVICLVLCGMEGGKGEG